MHAHIHTYTYTHDLKRRNWALANLTLSIGLPRITYRITKIVFLKIHTDVNC